MAGNTTAAQCLCDPEDTVSDNMHRRKHFGPVALRSQGCCDYDDLALDDELVQR